MIDEYGGKERYKSKAAMMRHEKGESKAQEKREKVGMFKPCKGCPTPAKCMKAGKCLKDRPVSKLVAAMGVKG